ncbi:putative amidase [Quercus suber]|uniref:Amidase n=1 Tax=Quercus suber TaxID=58331 RepID=A0AAW0JBH3_QUESU
MATNSKPQFCLFSLLLLILLPILSSGSHCTVTGHGFSIEEASVHDIQLAFKQNQLTSRQLVEFYLKQIHRLNPILKGVIECMVPKDAGVVTKLRKAGAIIIGKASLLSEWSQFRSESVTNDRNKVSTSMFCDDVQNPYVLSADPCGSSSGSAISVAANLVAVSLGSETDGSITCPSSSNSVVGVKPTIGLTSRAGVVPISTRQDTIGTVSDAVYVLDEIVGQDYNDKATIEASKYIPHCGYKQFLKVNGLKAKRLGIARKPFYNFGNDTFLKKIFAQHLDRLQARNFPCLMYYPNLVHNFSQNFRQEGLNKYLKELVASPVRTLADVIAFNKKFSDLEKIKEYGQNLFLEAQATNGVGVNSLLAIGGFPGISVPARYNSKGVPFGICFGGLKGSEPKLIEISYGFEQATKIRKPPSFKP